MSLEQDAVNILTEQIVRATEEKLRPLKRQIEQQRELLDRVIRYFGPELANAVGYKNFYKRGN